MGTLNQSRASENICWIIISVMSLLSTGSVSSGSFQGGEVDSTMTVDSEDFVRLFMGQTNKGGKFLKKLWCCVGGSITR